MGPGGLTNGSLFVIVSFAVHTLCKESDAVILADEFLTKLVRYSILLKLTKLLRYCLYSSPKSVSGAKNEYQYSRGRRPR